MSTLLPEGGHAFVVKGEWHARTMALVRKHGLAFTHNPWGGEFYHQVHGRCQIPDCDEREDYVILLAWCVEVGLERGA